jgi:hypothetical protein
MFEQLGKVYTMVWRRGYIQHGQRRSGLKELMSRRWRTHGVQNNQ